MVDDARAEGWGRDAREASARFFDTDNVAGRLAGMVLVLLQDGRSLAQLHQSLSGRLSAF